MFRRRRWFKGAPHEEGALADIAWFTPAGREMTEQDWREWFAKSFIVFLNGDALRSRDERGRTVHDDSFILLFNSHVDPVTFRLPESAWGDRWLPVLASESGFVTEGPVHESSSELKRPGLSLQVFRRV